MSLDLRRLKSKVFEQLKLDLEQKISTLHSEYKLYMESAANETKSTAGDKHDTSKSMMQLEQEKLGAQLQNFELLKKNIARIDVSAKEKVSVGALVKCNQGFFFMAIPWQQIEVENEKIFIISVQSPIARLMMGLKSGDSFNFASKNYKIIDIC